MATAKVLQSLFFASLVVKGLKIHKSSRYEKEVISIKADAGCLKAVYVSIKKKDDGTLRLNESGTR